jgi:hypothetical protein
VVDVADEATRQRRRAREALLADRELALQTRQRRRLTLRLPRTLPVPRAGRPSA